MKTKEAMFKFDIHKVRADFPLLAQAYADQPLIYFDNAATTQKPRSVLESIQHYYMYDNANIHRGIYRLSERSSSAYESVRATVQTFLNAGHVNEIIFTSGATEAINLVANGLGDCLIQSGDEILISEMEHHANLLPWQRLCEKTGALLKIIPICDDGSLDEQAYVALLNKRTKLVALTYVSHVLGTINQVEYLIEQAHQYDIPVLLDAAQAVPHFAVDVQSLDCDFCVFSGHKLYGPTGIGILYGKQKWLARMPPYHVGGGMVSKVTFEKTIYDVLPYKFEAGTPNISGAIGLQAAIVYVNQMGYPAIQDYETQLLQYMIKNMDEVFDVHRVGQALEKVPVVSFTMSCAHPHDIGTILDSEGVAIRVGHHCAMPLMDRLGVLATARASLAFYNTFEEIDVFIKGLEKIVALLGH